MKEFFSLYSSLSDKTSFIITHIKSYSITDYGITIEKYGI